MSDRLKLSWVTSRLVDLRREHARLSYAEQRERDALLEIAERRADDLTGPEIETLRDMLAEFEANNFDWEGGTEDVVALCRKMLRAHGAQ